MNSLPEFLQHLFIMVSPDKDPGNSVWTAKEANIYFVLSRGLALIMGLILCFKAKEISGALHGKKIN